MVRVSAILATFISAGFLMSFLPALPAHSAPPPAQVTPASDLEYLPGEVVCSLREGYSIEELNKRWGTTLLDDYLVGDIYLLATPEGADPDIFDELMETDAACAWAEPNYVVQTAEAIRQMVISATGLTYQDFVDQAVFDRIGLDEALERSIGADVLVAVIDTGVDMEHVAFTGRLSPDGHDLVDYDGYPDDVANGIDDDADLQLDEGWGHGTMVAGIITAVAPGATLLPIRVLDDEGRGDTYRVAKAIRYAEIHGAEVINMSFGLPVRVDAIAIQIAHADDAGVILVAGAGNENREEPAYYPARESRCAMVAAVDSLDVKASFSDYHGHVTVSAPGVAVRSAYPDDQWASGSGCSFATPFVSGEAALIRAYDPARQPDKVRKAIRDAVVPIYAIPGNEAYQGLLGTGRLYLPYALLTTDVARPSLEAAGIRAAPNPARGSVVLHLAASAEDQARNARDVRIYDISGRLIREIRGVIGNDVTWDGRDARGEPAPSGVYFARLGDGMDGRPGAGFALLR